MASSMCDEGLVSLWSRALNATPGPSTSPRIANLITVAFAAVPTQTYAALTWAGAGFPINMQALWAFALNPGGHYVSSVATVSWATTPLQAGIIFYGVGLYNGPGAPLFYVETFPAPYVVPAVAATLTWTFNLNYGDCAALAVNQ